MRAYRERSRRRYLRPEEVPAIARALDQLEARHPFGVALLRLMALTGARGGELLSARWDDWRPGQIYLTDSKTGDERWIHLPPSADEVICNLPRLNQWIFPRRDGKDHAPMKKPEHLWPKVLEASGLEDLRPHDLRHSFASFRLARGESLEAIGQLLGHKKVDTTRRYAHLIEEHAKRSVEDHSAYWDELTKVHEIPR